MISRCPGVLAIGLVAVLLIPARVHGEEHLGVAVETANIYNPCFGSGTDLSNSNQSGDEFINQLFTPNENYLGFNLVSHWQDSLTWDTDFLDPDTAGANPQDDDTDNFDQPGLAISFFQGHGLGNDKPVPDQLCISASECVNPPSGASVGNSGTGACVLSPASVATYGYAGPFGLFPYGVCEYKDARAMVTCGSGDANNHLPYLSPNMAFGENPTDGAWRGAGVNGGTSVAIVKMSFGMVTFFPTEWWNIFAGLQLYEGVMVSWGDSEDSPGFGGAVAAPYTANPLSSVSQGYLDAISSVTDGGGCAGATSWGGGFNGCGCHVAMTMSSSSAGVTNTFNENWVALETDNSQQTGNNYWWWGASCNYDPSAYPWSGGDNR